MPAVNPSPRDPDDGKATSIPIMPKNTSVELGDEIVSLINWQVKAGRNGSTSEVVRAGLRLLEVEETKMAALRSALIKGDKVAIPNPLALMNSSRRVNLGLMTSFFLRSRSACDLEEFGITPSQNAKARFTIAVAVVATRIQYNIGKL
jgi:antitoxin ParD1/3/4